MFSIDQVSAIWDQCLARAVKDREQYHDVYKLIDTYLSNTVNQDNTKKIMIGGTMGINLLLAKPRSLDDYEYELYTESSFLHANEITNKLADMYKTTGPQPTKLVFLRTVIPYRRYQIMVDSRLMIIIIDISHTTGTRPGIEQPSTVKVIHPAKVKSFDRTRDLLILSPEMILIDLYRTLYTPNNAESWEKAIHDENQLFKHLLSRLDELKTATHGGGTDKSPLTVEIRNKIQMALLKYFIQNNKDIVLIGDHGLRLMMRTPIDTSETGNFIVQCLSSNPDRDFSAIKPILEEIIPNVPITKSIRQLHIMQDFRLSRMAVKIGDIEAKEAKEILYLYNSATYDLIPINRLYAKAPITSTGDAIIGTSFIQVGNPFVILRFLLVDLWMINLTESLGGINNVYATHRRNSTMAKLLSLRQQMSAMSGTSYLTTVGKKAYNPTTPRFEVFQSANSDYVGEYIDEIISQKEKIKDLTRRYHDYYPQEYFNRNNEFRILKSDAE